MTTQELMAFVKTSLRVASESFDDEIQALIEAAEADITQATDKAFDITRIVASLSVVKRMCRRAYTKVFI